MSGITIAEAAAPVRKVRQVTPVYVKELRALAKSLHSSEIRVQRIDGWLYVLDEYNATLRRFPVSGPEWAALEAWAALDDLEIGEGFAARLRVKRSGPAAEAVTLLDRTVPGRDAMLKVCGVARGDETSRYMVDSIERLATAGESLKQGMPEVVRMCARTFTSHLNPERLGTFASAASVWLSGDLAPVQFRDARGEVMGVVMPLSRVTLAEEVAA